MNSSAIKIKFFLVKTTLKYFNLFVVLIITVLAAAGYYLFLEPEFKQIKPKSDLDEVEQYRDYLNNYLLKLQEMETLSREITDDVSDKIEKILPDNQDIPGLFVQLQAIAVENGLVLNSIDIAEDEEEPEEAAAGAGLAITTSAGNEIKRLNIAMDITGATYDKLKSFLSMVEYNLRLFNVDEIAFDVSENSALSYIVNLKTYYLNK